PAEIPSRAAVLRRPRARRSRRLPGTALQAGLIRPSAVRSVMEVGRQRQAEIAVVEEYGQLVFQQVVERLPQPFFVGESFEQAGEGARILASLVKLGGAVVKRETLFGMP